MSEPLSLIAVIVLLLYTPLDTAAFWLTIVALFGLLAMQVIYWTRTQPTTNTGFRARKELSAMSAPVFLHSIQPAGWPSEQTWAWHLPNGYPSAAAALSHRPEPPPPARCPFSKARLITHC